jgi:hypothetical protein
MRKQKLYPIDLIVLAVGIALVSLVVLRAHFSIPYNSDDVSQQVLLRQWMEYGVGGTWMSPDTFLLKIPFHYLIELVIPNSRLQVLITNLLFAWFYITATFVFIRHFTGRFLGEINHRFLYVAFFYVASMGSVANYLKNANLRNLEIGIMLLMFVAVSKFMSSKQKNSLSYVVLGLLPIFIGFFFYNDPAFLVFLGIPLAALPLLEWALSRKINRQYTTILGVILLSAFFFVVWSKLFQAFGINTYKVPSRFVSIDSLWSNLAYGVGGLLDIFGANFFGKQFESAAALLNLLNLAVLASGLLGLCFLIASKKRSAPSLLLAVLPLLYFLSYVFSSNVEGLGTARYLMPAIAFVALGLAVAALKDSAKGTSLVLLITVAATGLNTVANIKQIVHGAHQQSATHSSVNASDQKLADLLTQHNLSKGYAPFWNANITNYLSNNQTHILPYNCDSGRFRIFYWLISERVLNEGSSSSFLVLLQQDQARQNSVSITDYKCGKAALEQFGQTKEVIPGPNSLVLVYDHDIKDQFEARTAKNSPNN